jgi:hypothetical protein
MAEQPVAPNSGHCTDINDGYFFFEQAATKSEPRSSFEDATSI